MNVWISKVWFLKMNDVLYCGFSFIAFNLNQGLKVFHTKIDEIWPLAPDRMLLHSMHYSVRYLYLHQ
jgi:ubiquinone biosynthesis protein COQ9